jgi:guanylate kinase
MTQGKCIIFSAPSGAGKTTIVRHLLRNTNLPLGFSVSAASRASRPHEVDGQDYYFLTVDQFREKILADEFVEWEEVYQDHFYGTLKSEMARIWSENKAVVFDVDVVGGLNLKKYFGDDALALFVQAPSIEILEKRLRGRKTESEERIQMRIDKAQKEMQSALEFDEIIVNDDLEKALGKAIELISKFIETPCE